MPRRSGKYRREQGARSLSRYEFLAATHGPAVAARLRESKDSHWQGGSDAELFRRFAEKVDPSGTDKDKPWRYLKWACTRYLEAPVLPEDLYKIGEDLILFEDKKKRGLLKDGKADIQRYTIMTLADFTTELRGGALDGFDEMLAKAPVSVMDATTILYRDPEGIAFVPHSREASIHWSRGTRWCTGAENGDNQFFDYNINGPLVILFTAAGKERYQAHVNSPVMDAQDKEAVMTPKLSALLERVDGRFLKKKNSSSWTGPEEWSNRDYLLWRIRQNGLILPQVTLKLRADPEIVLEAVRQDGRVLQYAAPELRADREFILKVVRANGAALEFAAESLRADREIILEAVRQNGLALKFAAEILRADIEIVLEAIRQNGVALGSAHTALRADRMLVLDAIRSDGRALKFASEELQHDRGVVLEAVRQNGLALFCVAEEWQKDREIVFEAVRQYGFSLQYAAEELRKDRKIVLEAIQRYEGALQYAAPTLREDRDFILDAVRRNALTLEHVAHKFREDREIVIEATRREAGMISCAAKKLRDDPAFLCEALRGNPGVMTFIRPVQWTGINPGLKRESFMNGIGSKWTNLAYAADCGVNPDISTQRDAFALARKKNPDHLAKALHIFPALRNEWKKRALNLDEAAVLLGAVPENAGRPVLKII